MRPPSAIRTGLSRLSSIAVLCCLSAPARGDPEALGWRGDGSGLFPDAHPPLHWGPKTNIRWKAHLPGRAASSPVVVGNRVFVTADPSSILCFDADGGQLLWQHEVVYLDTVAAADRARAEREAASVPVVRSAYRAARAALDNAVDELRHREGTAEKIAHVGALQKEASQTAAALAALSRYRPPVPVPIWGTAGSTPLSDGRRVFALFGNDIAASFTVEGQLLWARHLPADSAIADAPERTARAQYASPQLADNILLAPMARLYGLDPDTGTLRWTGPPSSEPGTPGLAHLLGGVVALTTEGAAVRVRDGALLAEGIGRLVFIGPVVRQRTAFFVGAYDSGGATGLGLARARIVELPESATLPFVVRTLGEIALPPRRHFAAPLFEGAHLMSVDRDGTLTVLDADPFRVVETAQVGHAVVRAGVVLAGGYLFVANDGITDSVTTVVEAHHPWTEVASNTLERFTGSPFFAGRRMYVRSDENLYCVEEP